MSHIFKFLQERINGEPTYRAKQFQTLLKLARMGPYKCKTKPDKLYGKVNGSNTGETAFQRALYGHEKKIYLVSDGSRTLLKWKDIELPVTFFNRGRRHCVDLIGWTEEQGTFVCELKHAKTQQRTAGIGVDYAVFEALLYYAIANRDHNSLDEERVYRPPESPRFCWKDVSDSRVILILANDFFWTRARSGKDIERITSLITEIRKSLNIDVLLCSTPNYKFKLEGVTGEYEPRLVPCAEEIPNTAKAFPTYRLV